MDPINWTLELIKMGGSGIAGGIIGSFITHKFTQKRERESGRNNRRRDFVAFMAQLKAEAERTPAGNGCRFAVFYSNKIPNIKHAVSLIRGDLDSAVGEKLDERVKILTSFDADLFDAHNGRQQKGAFILDVDEVLKTLPG